MGWLYYAGTAHYGQCRVGEKFNEEEGLKYYGSMRTSSKVSGKQSCAILWPVDREERFRNDSANTFAPVISGGD